MIWTRSLSNLPKKAATILLLMVLVLSLFAVIPTVGLAAPAVKPPTRTPTSTRTPTRTPTPSGPTPTHTPTSTSTAVPGANFVGSPLSGAAPLTVQFTHVDSTLVLRCTWTFGDGATQPYTFTSPYPSQCPTTSHTYTTAGTYTVSLSVTKATNGNTNTVTKTNYIQVN